MANLNDSTPTKSNRRAIEPLPAGTAAIPRADEAHEERQRELPAVGVHDHREFKNRVSGRG